MQGEFNALKSFIIMENESAFYVHCFAYQLQLTLVAVAENHSKILTFFETVAIFQMLLEPHANIETFFKRNKLRRLFKEFA